VHQITSRNELTSLLTQRLAKVRSAKVFHTRFVPLDSVAPGGAFQCGAVHELLATSADPLPASFALLLAGAAQRAGSEDSPAVVIWSDPHRELYAPALAATGLALAQLVLIRPSKPVDELRMLAECLQCPGVAVTVAAVGRLTRVEARRLQLAAERGGGVGLFLRRFDVRSNTSYAAATRWLVTPVPGSEDVQRWSVELVHGHGGRVGERVLLEVDRESGKIHAVRPPSALADRPAAQTTTRASA
jgi:protein ImuA